jgi:hypothetical protein
MARIEYKAECLCGGKLETTFKKPTRFQPSVSKALCQGCASEFMFTCSIEYANNERAYVPEHKVLRMTAKLKEALENKKIEAKQRDVNA